MVGVTINDLPPETQEEIAILSKTANILECSDSSSTRFALIDGRKGLWGWGQEEI